MFKLDNDLLSHGETPHYHRRCIVSLLSSGWDQVVPTLYVRQAILSEKPFSAVAVIVFSNQACDISIKFVRLANFRSQFVFPNCLGVIWSSLTGN